jgi:hypothetical protein
MNCICSSCKKENLRCFYINVEYLNLPKCWEKIELSLDNSKYYHYENDDYPHTKNSIIRSVHDIDKLNYIFNLDNIICQECYTIMDIIK